MYGDFNKRVCRTQVGTASRIFGYPVQNFAVGLSEKQTVICGYFQLQFLLNELYNVLKKKLHVTKCQRVGLNTVCS